MTLDGRDASGTLAWMRTVYLSRTSTLSMVSIAPRSQSPPMAGFLMRMMFSFTASASTSRPLWNSTPLRSRKVQAVSSLLGSQLSAMPGHDVAPLVEIGQAGIHHGGGNGDVVLIMRMGVEAARIDARAIEQGAAAVADAACQRPPDRRGRRRPCRRAPHR